MRPRMTIAVVAAAGLLLAGCATQAAEQESPTSVSAADGVFAGDLAPAAVLAENADATIVRDDEWSAADAVDVALDGVGTSSAAAGVTSDAGTVTLTAAGVYRLSGTLDGSVVVDAPDDALVVLILDGATITSRTGAAIEVRSADDVAIHLAAGSTNTVSDAAADSEAAANAAIWADTDLTISGSGSLAVTGTRNDGIASTDDLAILDGAVTVVAADDALRGKDSLIVEGGALTLEATGGDGLKSDGDDDAEGADIDWTRGYISVRGGTIDIVAGDDGVQAFTDTVIVGGTITAAVADDGIKAEVVVTIGEAEGIEAPHVTVRESVEGIEAANVSVSAGVIDVTASDDGLNASGNAELQARIAGTGFADDGNPEADTGERLEIHGGSVTVVAGFDGLDSNGSITITGGAVTITSAAFGGDAPIDANGDVSVVDGAVTANGEPWDESMIVRMGPGAGGGAGQMPPGGPGGELPEMPDGQVPGGQFPGGQAPDGQAPQWPGAE